MQLIGLALTVSIFLGVLAVGMRVVPGDLQYLWSRPRRLVRSLLAMNVLAPIVAVLVCRTFSLHGAVIVALVTLSIAPVGALFSQAMLPLVAPGHASYARGLFFASTVLSVVLTPLVVEVTCSLARTFTSTHWRWRKWLSGRCSCRSVSASRSAAGGLRHGSGPPRFRR